MMKYTSREITRTAIITALMIVLGYILYLLSRIIPLPGSKFITMSAFLSLMLTLAVEKVGKKGIFLLISTLFALIMSMISVLMGIAILSSGLATEILGLTIFNGYENRKTRILTAALYPALASLSFFLALDYLSGGNFPLPPVKILIFLFFIIYLLGLFGSRSAYYLLDKEIF